MTAGLQAGRLGWLVFALALALRVAYILEADASPLFEHPAVDAKTYTHHVQRLAAGNWLGVGEGPFWQPPLYPYFLGGGEGSFSRVVFLRCALCAGSARGAGLCDELVDRARFVQSGGGVAGGDWRGAMRAADLFRRRAVAGLAGRLRRSAGPSGAFARLASSEPLGLFGSWGGLWCWCVGRADGADLCGRRAHRPLVACSFLAGRA